MARVLAQTRDTAAKSAACSGVPKKIPVPYFPPASGDPSPTRKFRRARRSSSRCAPPRVRAWTRHRLLSSASSSRISFAKAHDPSLSPPLVRAPMRIATCIANSARCIESAHRPTPYCCARRYDARLQAVLDVRPWSTRREPMSSGE